MRKIEQKLWLDLMKGHEVWTNAFGERFGERVCVGVEYPHCIHGGVKFTPTTKEVVELIEDFITQELGSPQQRATDLKREFG